MVKRATDAREIGHEPLVLCEKGTRIDEMVNNLGLKSVYVSLKRNYFDGKFIRSVVASIHYFEPEAIIVGKTNLLAQIYSALFFIRKKPQVFLYKQMQSGIKKKDPLHNFIYRHLSGAIVLTPFMKDLLLQSTIIDAKKIAVIPYGIELEKYSGKAEQKSGLREKFGLEKDKFTVGIVARFDPQKDHATAVKAVKEIVNQGKNDIQLVMVGSIDDDNRENLEMLNRLIADLELQNHVKFLNFSQNIAELMNCFDVFILPTRSETFGLVLIEAMACEIPVIGSRSGGVPFIIEEEKSGLMFESGNYLELSQKIEKVMLNQDFARKIGKNGRAKAEKMFKYTSQVV